MEKDTFNLKHWLTSEKKFPIKIFLLAIIIRVIPVFFSYNLGIGLDDMFQYDMLARSIESGNGYRWYALDDLKLIQQYFTLDMSNVDYDPRGILTSFRPPLYPSFLALVYYIFGVGAKRFFIARLSQVLLSAALVPLIYYISRFLFPEKKAVWKIAAWIITFYPMLVIYPLSLATENLFFLMLLGSFYSLLLAESKRRWYWFVLSGFLLGLTALTRSIALAFAGLAILWIWLVLKEFKKSLLVFFLVCIVTLPWMVRNTLLHHKLTGIESALGYDLYVGYHPQSSGTFQYGISLDLMSYLDDGIRDEIGQAKALEFIKADPGRIPYLMIRRLGYFWGLERRALTYFYSNNYFGYIPNIYLIPISIILVTPFILLCIYSAFSFATIKWNKVNILTGALIIGYLTPHIFILGEDRFHFSLIPILAITAAHSWEGGWKSIWERWQSSKGKIALLIAIIVSFLLIFNWGTELIRDRTIISLLFKSGGNILYLPY